MPVQQISLFETPGAGQADHKMILRDIRNYLAGAFVGATRDEALLDEVAKCLFTRIYLERSKGLKEQDLYEEGDSAKAAKFFRQVFGQVKAAHPDLFDASDEFLLDPVTLTTVMRLLSALPVVDATRDAIGDAFEMFTGSHLRGQSGQFFTPKNATKFLVEAVSPSSSEIVIDPACGAGGFLSTTLQYLLAGGAEPEEIYRFANNNLFGIDKDEYLVRLARIHVALLSGASPQVECADSLAWACESPKSIEDFPGAGDYDVVLTNPPFGSKIVAASGDVLKHYQLSRKWRKGKNGGDFRPTSTFHKNVPPQVLFIERCIQLLKPGGRLGVVLPESLISSSRYSYVVEFIRSQCDIELVAGMPEALFKTSGKGGTHTKTVLVVLTRKKLQGKRTIQSIFMAEAKWCGHDSRGRTIPHDDLPRILRNYAAFRGGELEKPSGLGFVVEADKIREHLLAPRQYDPSVAQEIEALERTHKPIRFGDLVEQGIVTIATGDEVGKLAYGTGSIPFVRTSDLSNWEIKIDAKHGVSEEIFERYALKQDVQPEDILMVRDGTYLIGTCAMVTQADLPLVYQSHIYKIRVQENSLGIDPYLLLGLLSSSVVQRQVRSKRVTQDIIDSLGNRVMDLMLPLPKSDDQRKEISDMVRQVIEHRVTARKLALTVREVVAAGVGS